jgi:hypothetical protein
LSSLRGGLRSWRVTIWRAEISRRLTTPRPPAGVNRSYRIGRWRSLVQQIWIVFRCTKLSCSVTAMNSCPQRGSFGTPLRPPSTPRSRSAILTGRLARTLLSIGQPLSRRSQCARVGTPAAAVFLPAGLVGHSFQKRVRNNERKSVPLFRYMLENSQKWLSGRGRQRNQRFTA